MNRDKSPNPLRKTLLSLLSPCFEDYKTENMKGAAMKKAYKDIYTDVYKIHAKYGRISPDNRDDSYWEAVVMEVSEYSEANPGTFVIDLLAVMLDELERSGKND